ncbi:MAG TPA: WD40 repeat domain-containing protein [Anaerolineales bacterium]|nr:WD40 repeat domain-containing protein [Anaerolineales bacterium]
MISSRRAAALLVPLVVSMLSACAQIEITAIPTVTSSPRPSSTPEPTRTPTPDAAATQDAARYIRTVQAFQTQIASEKATERAGGGEEIPGWDGLAPLAPENAGALQVVASYQTGTVFGATFSPDGRHAVLLVEGETIVLSLEDPSGAVSIPGDTFSRIAFRPGGTGFAAGNEDGEVYLSGADGEPPHPVEGFAEPLSGLAYSPSGDRLVTAALDGSMHILDAVTGETLHIMDTTAAFGESTSPGPIWFSPDGTTAAIFLTEQSAVWVGTAAGLLSGDLQGEIIPWTEHAGPVAMVHIDPGWETMAWISRATLQLMTFGGDMIGGPGSHMDWLFNPTFVPELDLFFVTTTESGGDSLTGLILGYSLSTGGLERRLAAAEPISAFVTVPGQPVAVSGHSDGSVRVWDLSAGTLVHDLPVFSGPILLLAISPDGALLAAGDGQGEILLIDRTTGVTVHTLAPGTPGFAWIAFDPGGRSFTVIGETGTVSVYGVEP